MKYYLKVVKPLGNKTYSFVDYNLYNFTKKYFEYSRNTTVTTPKYLADVGYAVTETKPYLIDFHKCINLQTVLDVIQNDNTLFHFYIGYLCKLTKLKPFVKSKDGFIFLNGEMFVDDSRNEVKWLEIVNTHISKISHYNKVYSVLVEFGGADESDRQSFMYEMFKPKPTDEYRFQGKFGFGGKYWTRRNQISMYRENITDKLTIALDKVNLELKKLDEIYKKTNT